MDRFIRRIEKRIEEIERNIRRINSGVASSFDKGQLLQLETELDHRRVELEIFRHEMASLKLQRPT